MTMILDGTNGAFLPTWTTATRPASPANGEIGYNSTTGQIDQYVGGAWSSVPTGSGTVNSGTAYQLAYYASTGTAVSTLGSLGTSGQVLTSGGAGVAPTWTTISAGSAATPTARGVIFGYSDTQGNTGQLFTGYLAGASSTGSYNVGSGYRALYTNVSGASNVAIGALALELNTASYNTAVGHQALQSNTTSNNNTAVGYQALYNSTNRGNTGLGYQAGSNITTGEYNVHIGFSALASGTAASYEVVIAAGPSGYTGKGTSTAFINGGAGGSYNGANSTSWAVTSDQRLKKNIVDNNIGLDKISSIQVRNFEYRVEEEITELPKHCAINKTGLQLGVIAQELQTVLPECVKTESTGVMSLDADNLTWYMINAIKELSAEVNALKARLGA